MNTMFTIVIGLAMFMFLVTIHEAGHFFGAKFSGIKVNEFSVGMGPTLLKKETEETKYSLRALPIGGYVAMEGEEESSNDPRAYDNAKAWKRFITILAGPAVNIIFAIIIFFILSFMNGVPTTTIKSVSENHPAQMAGVEAGDRIISINDENTKSFSDVLMKINQSDGEVKLGVERNGQSLEFNIEPQLLDTGQKVLGFSPVIRNDFMTNLSYAINHTFFIMQLIWESLKGLVSGALGLDQLSGPVAVIQQVGQSVNLGITGFLTFAAMISVNLGFFNLLPIPALDGSKLLFIAIEMITGKRINKKFEERITIIGFLFLLGLIILVTIKDIRSLF